MMVNKLLWGLVTETTHSSSLFFCTVGLVMVKIEALESRLKQHLALISEMLLLVDQRASQ